MAERRSIIRNLCKVSACIALATAANVSLPMVRPIANSAATQPPALPDPAVLATLSDDPHRIQFLERVRAQFPPEKSECSHYHMKMLYELYLRTDPQKAVKLAHEMLATVAGTSWLSRVELAQEFTEIHRRLSLGKTSEALDFVGKLKPEKYSFEDLSIIGRFKARLMASAGQQRLAYQTLLSLQANAPEDETGVMLQEVGGQLHKSPARVQADVNAVVDARATPAPPFDLQKYASSERVSLAELRGKAVLLTFWFPSCAPCASEFPHFETVIQRLRQAGDDVAYIGVNMMRDQDSYVLPLIEKKKYTFTALKGPQAAKGAKNEYAFAVPTGYSIHGAPTNFVIDRSGKIVYRDFIIEDTESELMLQRMLESVLEVQR